jgi:hypothetical protein
MVLKRFGVILGCTVLAGCAYLSPPSASSPIASWSGKRSIDEAVDCVQRALDYNFRSVEPFLPNITHHVDAIEQGRVYNISPLVGPYHVRVGSNGGETTTVELFMPQAIYSVPLRDSLAKCP